MSLRSRNIEQLGSDSYDVLIIGGGINGAVAAAALAAKGVNAALIEKGDFASGTSSQSSNLVWGGIKYLEDFEFLLVNKLCKSRNKLLQHYPSTVKEIRFLTTIAKGFRYPVVAVYLSTLLYWLIGRFATRAPDYHSVKKLQRIEPLINTANAQGGFEYSDCYLYDNDARFVFNFIRAAMDDGCCAANYVESLSSTREQQLWITQARDSISGKCFSIRSKVLVNACGPWVDHYNQLIGQKTQYHHLFSKGIHLIVDKIGEYDRVLTFFASDGRLFFVIPMGSKTCIGTTDTQVQHPDTEVSDQDREFVLDNINALLDLDKPLTAADVIAERCGVRPLAQRKGAGSIEDCKVDWVKLSRKHAIDVNRDDRYLSIFGGKLTDCLNVGNEVAEWIEKLGVAIPERQRTWYGEPDAEARLEFLCQARQVDLDSNNDAGCSEPVSARLWRRYGKNACYILQAIRDGSNRERLRIGNADYLRAEIELLAEREMITKLDDFLRRRSNIAQVIRHRELLNSPGLKTACNILFGGQAEQKLIEYADIRSTD